MCERGFRVLSSLQCVRGAGLRGALERTSSIKGEGRRSAVHGSGQKVTRTGNQDVSARNTTSALSLLGCTADIPLRYRRDAGDGGEQKKIGRW